MEEKCSFCGCGHCFFKMGVGRICKKRINLMQVHHIDYFK